MDSEYSFFEILYKHHTVLNSGDLFKVADSNFFLRILC